MKRKWTIGILMAAVLSSLVLTGCGSSGTGGSSGGTGSSGYGSSSSGNIGAGGYEMPNENDRSFSDYVQRVDPDLWNDMQSRWDSLDD